MSATIEFRRWVFASTVRYAGLEKTLYIGIAESGTSNLFEWGSNRIARSTAPLLVELNYRFMQRIVEIATDCEGGMLKLSGRWTRPEGYIAAWRKAQESAIDLRAYVERRDLSLRFPSVVAQLQARRGTLDMANAFDRRRARRIDDLIIDMSDAGGVEERQETRFGESVLTTEFVLTPDTLDATANLIARALAAGVQLGFGQDTVVDDSVCRRLPYPAVAEQSR